MPLADRDEVPQRIELVATADGPAGASLAWTSAGDGLSYRLERNGALARETTGLVHVERGLEAGERYCWRVYARNGFGWQARSNEACLGTAPDTADWRVERVGAGRWPAIAVDAAGDVHLCWTATTGAGVSWLRFAPGLSPEVVDADGQGACSIAVDADGVVHVAYTSRFGLRHATRSSSGPWRAATVDAEGLVGAQRFDGPALALAADGTPRIAYRRPIGDGLASIAVASRVGGGWRFDLTGIGGLVGPHSLALDAAGVAHLATTDTLGQSLIVWRRTGGAWRADFVQSLAPNRGDGPPIALDATGAARTAWWQRASTATTAATVLRWVESTAAGWRTETIAPASAAGTRVAIAGVDSTPHVAVVDATGTVRVYARDGGAWVEDTLEAQGGAAAALDLAIGPDRQLRLVFDRIDEGSVVLASRAR